MGQLGSVSEMPWPVLRAVQPHRPVSTWAASLIALHEALLRFGLQPDQNRRPDELIMTPILSDPVVRLLREKYKDKGCKEVSAKWPF